MLLRGIRANRLFSLAGGQRGDNRIPRRQYQGEGNQEGDGDYHVLPSSPLPPSCIGTVGGADSDGPVSVGSGGGTNTGGSASVTGSASTGGLGSSGASMGVSVTGVSATGGVSD